MIKPLHNYVLLEVQPEEKKVGSIILAVEKEKHNVATVVAVGEGSVVDGKLVPVSKDIQVGKRVLYKEYSTTEFKEGDKKYLLVRGDDIIAVVE